MSVASCLQWPRHLLVPPFQNNTQLIVVHFVTSPVTAPSSGEDDCVTTQTAGRAQTSGHRKVLCDLVQMFSATTLHQQGHDSSEVQPIFSQNIFIVCTLLHPPDIRGHMECCFERRISAGLHQCCFQSLHQGLDIYSFY